MVVQSASSPLSYVNSPFFFLTFLTILLVSTSLITGVIALTAAGVLTYLYNLVLNKKHTVQSNEAILITGAGGGIGFDSAVHSATEGFHVYASYRKQADGDKLKQAHKNITPIQLDVTKQSDIDNAVKTIQIDCNTKGYKLIALINNAGYGEFSPVELISQELLKKQYETNVFGLINVTQAFLPLLRKYGTAERTSRVINISSVVGRFSVCNGGIYSSTKFAVESLGDALRGELQRYNVDVINVQPGAIQTEFRNTAQKAVTNTLDLTKRNKRYDVEPAVLEHYEHAIDKNMNQVRGTPTAVAHVVTQQIDNAIRHKRPLAKYLAGVDAQLIPILCLLPSYIQDKLLAKNFA